MKNIKSTKGFTLIEIMLVIGIITLLASVAMFSMTEAKKKAQDAKMIAESKQVETAIALFKDSNPDEYVPHATNVGQYPLGELYQEGTDGYDENLRPLVHSGYFKSIPRSPDGQSYAYGVAPDRKRGVFVANLKTRSSNNGGSNPADYCVQVGSQSSNNGELCSQIYNCGLSPSIIGIGAQYDSGNGEYSKDISVTDPEGKNIIFNFVESSPGSPDSCFVSGNTAGCAFVSNNESQTIVFSYRTENCPIQTSSVTISNPNYTSNSQSYTLTINVGAMSDDNTGVTLYQLITDQNQNATLNPIQSPVTFSEGEIVDIYAEAYNSVTEQYVMLEALDCDAPGPTSSEGTSCSVLMDRDKTIFFREVQ